MTTRGRKSASSQAIVSLVPGARRPKPPAELTPEQAAEWQIVVDRMTPDWFTPETHGILCEYCRHRVKARTIAQLIDEFELEWMRDDDGLRRWRNLAQLAELESRAMASLATRMRLTQQSRYDHKSANTAASKGKGAAKPWEFGDPLVTDRPHSDQTPTTER